MQCDVCQQETATVFLTQIVGGKMQKVNLCESCSKEKGINDPTGFALADLLPGMGESEEYERTETVLKCSVCGFTQGEFKKAGRLGCSACYDVFTEGLEPLLKNVHKGSEHIGKAPESFRETRVQTERLKTLQTGLDRAVKAEEFEKAANLRDQIRQIETGSQV